MKVENLSKNFNSLHALQHINLSLHKGEVVTIIGPSGAGKTTLLRCIGLLEPFDEGNISTTGTTVTALSSEKNKEGLRKNIGFVFQDFNLWPHKTVLENVAESLITVRKWWLVSKHGAVRDILHSPGQAFIR